MVDGSPRVIIGVNLDGLPRSHRKRILAGAVELRITLLDPLLVFLVTVGGFTYDAPFCPWINGDDWGRVLLDALDSSDATVEVAFVHDGHLLRMHRLKTVLATGRSIAEALRSCSLRPDAQDYDLLVEAYQARLSPNQLLAMSRRQDQGGRSA